jgi:hypothetical protein
MANSHAATVKETTTLLIGFDSAWTAHNSGAIVGVLSGADGSFRELGPPQIVNYAQGQEVILAWQTELAPAATIILLDQPTIVPNPEGHRPVENIVGSMVSRRYGGMQPANTSQTERTRVSCMDVPDPVRWLGKPSRSGRWRRGDRGGLAARTATKQRMSGKVVLPGGFTVSEGELKTFIFPPASNSLSACAAGR